MAVNTMSVEDAYALMNALHAQVTGQNSIQATDLSSFVSGAQETLSAGYDADHRYRGGRHRKHGADPGNPR